MDFAAVERARIAAKMTPTAMCRVAGVPGYNYWRARKGAVQPSKRTLDAWMRAILQQPKSPKRTRETAQLVRSNYRAHLALVAREMGFNPEEVTERPQAREFWRARAIALASVAADLDLRHAEIARALGLSKQIVNWNIKQALSMPEASRLAWFVEKSGRLGQEAAE